MSSQRELVLAGLLGATALLASFVLLDVLATVFFAITIAYVLVPARNELVGRGLSARIASAFVTASAFAIVSAIVAAFGVALYLRRASIFSFIAGLPEVVDLPLGPFVYTIETAPLLETATAVLQSLAVTVAGAAPVLALKLLVFAFVVFALLIRPGAMRETFFDIIPPEYHDVVVQIDDRIRATLYGIYVLQAATAAGTFFIALAVFFALGYESAFTLALLAALFQFVPVLGPSLIIAGLAVADVAGGSPERAVLVVVLGGVFVAATPDAIIRPRLAPWAADLPTSLYFIGFVGGVLTVGAIGFVAGPLVVALLAEVVSLLAKAELEHHGPHESDHRSSSPMGPSSDLPTESGSSPDREG